MVIQINLKHYINKLRTIRILGVTTSIALSLLAFLTIFPIMDKANSAEATFVPSTTTLTMTTGQTSANLDIAPISANGTFATTTSTDFASFDIVTNNYTGYTLKLLGNDATGELTNASYGDTIDSVSTITSETDFSTNSTYTNQWGIKPSKYVNSGTVIDNTTANNYLPAPIDTGVSATTTEILMDTTTAANTTANNYTIGLGVRVDYTKPTGTYTNTYTLVAIGNPTSFTITYNKGNISDTVTDMPSGLTTGNTDETYVALSSTIPKRTGYTFAGWCNGTLSGTTANPGTTCTGELITDGKFDLNQTTSNTVPLYATWTANQYTCTKQYRLQNADGTWGSYTTDTAASEQITWNNTCSYSKTVTDYKNSASGTNGSQASTSGTMNNTSGIILSLSFYRNTYTLTVNRNTTYLSVASATTAAAHGSNYYRWGQSVAISATTNYSNFTKWTLTNASGTQISTAASTNYTMPKANTTIYANGDRPNMADFTKSACSSRASSGNIWLNDARDGQYYTARYINGNCWMTRNIAIGCNGSGASYSASRKAVSLTNSNSNVSTTWNTSSAGAITSGPSHDNPLMQCNSNYGAWYNYAAATADTIKGSSTSTTASEDICPIGWKLPALPIMETIGSPESSTHTSAFNPTVGGNYDNSAILVGTDRGTWWGSTAISSTNRSSLYYRSNSNKLSAPSDTGGSREDGRYVRCVRSN